MSRVRSDWIESAGGPLVMMPLSVRAAWKGVRGEDYREACAVEDSLGSLARPWGDVLVLGDEPLRTAVLFRPDGPCLLRWMHAPDERRLLKVALEARFDGLAPTETLKVDVRDEPYALFDGGADGLTAGLLEFKPPAGPRLIRTDVVRDDAAEVGLILHCF
nr:Imm21 family immunity protein [Corallococcus sicarius]